MSSLAARRVIRSLAVSLMLLLAGVQGSMAATLVGLMTHGSPVAVLDHLVELGRTIDLTQPNQVRAAIGPAEHLKARRSQSSGFVGYTVPQGEIVFNPDQPGRTVLIVTVHRCIPLPTLLARLGGPDFTREPRRITVALYTDVPYRTHAGTSFTYHDGGPACVSSFGLAQRTSST